MKYTKIEYIEKNIFLVRDQRGVRLLWREAPFSYQGDLFSNYFERMSVYYLMYYSYIRSTLSYQGDFFPIILRNCILSNVLCHVQLNFLVFHFHIWLPLAQFKFEILYLFITFLRLLELQTWTLIFPVILRWVVLPKISLIMAWLALPQTNQM